MEKSKSSADKANVVGLDSSVILSKIRAANPVQINYLVKDLDLVSVKLLNEAIYETYCYINGERYISCGLTPFLTLDLVQSGFRDISSLASTAELNDCNERDFVTNAYPTFSLKGIYLNFHSLTTESSITASAFETAVFEAVEKGMLGLPVVHLNRFKGSGADPIGLGGMMFDEIKEKGEGPTHVKTWGEKDSVHCLGLLMDMSELELTISSAPTVVKPPSASKGGSRPSSKARLGEEEEGGEEGKEEGVSKREESSRRRLGVASEDFDSAGTPLSPKKWAKKAADFFETKA